MIFSSLKQGIKTTFRLHRIVGIFYLVNLLAGLLVMFPFRGMIADFAGSSLMGERLISGINGDFIFEFMMNNSGGIEMLTGIIVVVSLVYGLIGLFLSGGVFSILVQNEGWNSALFWSGSAKYLGRFIRLWLVSIPVFVFLYAIQFLEIGVVRLVFGEDPYQNVKVWSAVIRVVLGFMGILLYYMTFDYARIEAVRSDSYSMTKALWKGIRFTLSNLIQAFGIAIIMFVVGIVFLVIFKLTSELIGGGSLFSIVMLILIQQGYILLKVATKLILYSGEYSLFEQRSPKPVEIAIESTMPVDDGKISPQLGVTM